MYPGRWPALGYIRFYFLRNVPTRPPGGRCPPCLCRAFPSATLAAAVRAHFGLTQAELAAFVGVSRPGLAAAEAGRKPLGPGPDQRLQVLARQLPPPDGHGPPAAAFAEAAAATASAALAPLATIEKATPEYRGGLFCSSRADFVVRVPPP